MMLVLILLTIILSPIMPASFTIASLAFVASIQVETFRRLRGAPYANVMMTGNVKMLLTSGLKELLKRFRT